MRGQFTGWPEQAMDVLWQLQGEPTHATRERYRADRERLVRQPMIALLNEIADTDPRYEDFSVWHYRTDSWWWQHQGAVIRLGLAPGGGVMIALDPLSPVITGRRECVYGDWRTNQVPAARGGVETWDPGRRLAARQ
ncbi:hypothetical protein [Streptomyces sp. NPDC005507]|uniref:hypothetical protein n=1 Tax=Streptomyces sp. NPDC005507 TaxID=3154885 RepID=UPI0033BD55CF